LKEKLTSVEMDSVFALMHNMRLFLERLEKFKKKHEVSEQEVELRFGMTRDLRPVPFYDKSGELFFRGVWDLCLRAHEQYLIVVDHKTSEVSNLEKYDDQLRTYALAGLHAFPDIQGVQTAIHFVKDEDGLHWAKMMSAEQIRSEVYPWFVNWLNAAGNGASTGNPKKGWWCKFCQHTELCPLKR